MLKRLLKTLLLLFLCFLFIFAKEALTAVDLKVATFNILAPCWADLKDYPAIFGK